MGRYLFTSDIHLSDRPRDAYRWDIFRWLEVQAQNRKADAVFLLGDITDQKDKHSNLFINQVVDAVRSLAAVVSVYMLKGNHDYSDPSAPLLRFLKHFYVEPKRLTLGDDRFLLLPNLKSQQKDSPWLEALAANRPADFDFVLCHQTFSGAKAENGIDMAGIDSRDLEPAKHVVSGDIHVPQKLGCVRYCGAPHPIRFGDTFAPRVLFWDGVTFKSISRTTIKKAVVEVTSVDELTARDDLTSGDQVKVRLVLPRSEFKDWEQTRAAVRELATTRGWDLCGIELQEKNDQKRTQLRGKPKVSKQLPMDVFESFCKHNEVDESLVEAGRKLLTGES